MTANVFNNIKWLTGFAIDQPIFWNSRNVFPEFVDNIRKVQAEVLENYSKIVKPGGKLVYATCSVLPSENQEQIKQFLSTEIGKEFNFVKDQKVLASESGFDGFYMALLERKK